MRLAPNVTCDMLDAAFWLDRIPDPDSPLLTQDQIAAFNAQAHELLDIPPVLSLPDVLSRANIEAQMRAYLPNQTLYNAEGQPIEPGIFERVLANVIKGLPDRVVARFGLVAQRTSVRAFPTVGVITSRPFEYALDRIQETTVDVGWPAAILMATPDEQWAFCLTPLYWGWVRLEHVALGRREQAASFVESEPFIVTTAPQGGLVNLATGQTQAAQMGTRLPLAGEMPDVYQTFLPFIEDSTIGLAVRGSARQEDFSLGYLPLTRRTLFTQAFKLLGELYAWGGSRFGLFGRDCSRFIQDVYATTGVHLPRNGKQQGQVCHTTAAFTPDMDDKTRQAALIDSVSPGAILELHGHVMLYLGHVEGSPYVIHNTSSGGFSEVIVSDLSLGTDSPSGSLLGRLIRAVEIK